MEAQVYNKEGKAVGKITLPAELFAVPFNSNLIHQVVVSMQSNARTPVAHTKDRSEVRGGGRKPWRQKGTGRARHGSIRSPIWIGGGVTHGPRKEKSYAKKINKKMKARALFSVLSRKFKDGEIIFVEDISFSKPTAQQAKQMLRALSSVAGNEDVGKKKNAALITVPEKTTSVFRSFTNFSNVMVEDIKNINPLQALSYKYIIISNPEKSIDALFIRITSKKASEKEVEKKKAVKKPKQKETQKKPSDTSDKRKTEKKVIAKTR